MSKNKEEFVKEITNIDEDFAQWYTDIVLKAELADYSATKGCIVIRPYGYELWERIQEYADQKFKETGVKNVSFPSLIPESLLQKEKDHVEGFAPEVAWVTNAGGQDLDERLCIRPTSETIISTMYSKWLTSWRDLPYLYNQWCNVLRWEKETRPFLRSREFLWQEGHTIHETAKEAKDRTKQMLEIYSDVIENLLAIPVIKGLKTESEKFAGAEETYTVETLTHDGRALQSGTSHYFGQNFTIPFDIKFQNRDGEQEYAYQTSWGISTRLIGGLIMAHGDNRGLKLPPRVAPIQVVIVPIAQHKEGVLEKANELFESLKTNFRVHLDDRDQYSTGYKFNDWEMRGVPARIELGPKDIENGKCVVVRRDTGEKIDVALTEIQNKLAEILEEIQKNMFQMCLDRMKEKTSVATNMDEFKANLEKDQGLIKSMWCGSAECEDKIHEETGAKSRCLPFVQEHLGDKCVYCGKPASKMVVWGRQY
ncbi:MAG: proline--tRNA ligase [Clostridia bacterium]|nr:proline--tRNA ligase [Clostridia bacterium]